MQLFSRMLKQILGAATGRRKSGNSRLKGALAPLLVLCALAISTGVSFAASAGCDAVNGGALNASLVNVADTNQRQRVVTDAFDIGETLNYSYSGELHSAARLIVRHGAPPAAVSNTQEVDAIAPTAPVSGSGSYVVDTSGGAVSRVTVQSSNTNSTGSYTADINAVVDWTVSCSPAGAPATVPGVPAIGTATAGNANASVGFTAAANGGSPITLYTVTSNPENHTGTGTTSPITVNGLTNGTAYTFTVQATNTVGTGSASGASNVVTPKTVPGAPTIGTAVAGNAQASVVFTAPASNGGSAITDYTVTSNPGGLTAHGTTSPITIAGLTNGTPYSFTVTATNGAGTGTASGASSSVTPMGLPVAGAVSATVAYNSSANPITLILSGGTATSVTVESAPTNGLATVSGVGIVYTPNANYAGPDSFTYSATNTDGTSAPATVTITVSAAVPDAPTIGAVTPGDRQVSVAFTPPAPNGSAISDYTVTSNPGGVTAHGTASPIVVTGLTNGTPYTFTVTATNGAGPSNPSAASTPATPLGVPVAGAVSTNVAYGSSDNLVPLALSGGVPISVSVTSAPSHGTATALGSTISYTPTAGYYGPDSFSYDASNASGVSAPAIVSVTVAAPVLAVTPSSLPAATVSVPYSQSLLPSGGQGPYAFATTVASGALPPGLTLASDGTISGTPTDAGPFNFTVTVTDSSMPTPVSSVSGAISLTVAASTLVFTPPSGALDPAMLGEGYVEDIAAAGGSGTVLYDNGPGLPTGIILNRTTGRLSGTVDDAVTPGDYSFTITAADTHGNAGAAAYTLKVLPRAVTAVDMAIVIAPGTTPLPVDLTKGATGGPFTAAVVGTVTPSVAGTAEVIMGDVAAMGTVYPTTFYLKFHPNPEFSGTAVIGYTLVGAGGATSSATISFITTLDVVAVANRFDSLVHGFVQSRQSLLANAIEVPGLQQRRAMAAGNSPGTVNIAPDGNDVTLNFASSLAEMRAWGEAGDAAGTLAATPPDQSPFNVWIDGTATLHLRSEGDEAHWGKFGLVSVGADYLVNDKLLIGLALHANGMDDVTDTSTVSGTDVLAGPYVSSEIGDGVFLDASVFYGQSWNTASTSIFSGNFQTQQVLVNAKLEGEWALGDNLTFRPNAAAFYLHESVDDYSISNALGEAVILSGFTTDQVRLSVGGTLEYAMAYGDGLTLTPSIGAKLGLSSTNGSSFVNGTFGQLSGGLTLTGAGDWSLGGDVDLGLDAAGLKSISAKARLGVNY